MFKAINFKPNFDSWLIINLLLYSLIPTVLLTSFQKLNNLNFLGLFLLILILNFVITSIISNKHNLYVLNMMSFLGTLYLVSTLKIEIHNLASVTTYSVFAALGISAVLLIYNFIKQEHLVNLLAIYLIVSFNLRNSQPIKAIDIFHEGEWLAPATFIQQGLVPYKDFLPIHGALKDGILPYISFKIFGTTVLSARLFDSIITHILISISIFLLLRAIIKISHPLFVLVYLLLDQSTLRAFYVYSDARYIPLLFMALATFYCYKYPNKLKVVIFAFASCLTIFLSPELIIFVGPANFLLAVRSYSLLSIRESKQLGLVYFGSNAIFLCVMFLTGILEGIFDLIFRFSSNLWLVGGVPMVWENMSEGSKTVLFMYVFIYLILLFYLIFISSKNKKLDWNFYWTLLIFISLAFSFSKFITRMGSHIYETMPYITLANIALISLLQSSLKKFKHNFDIFSKNLIEYAQVFLALLLISLLGLPKLIDFASAGREIYVNRIGYSTPEYLIDKQFKDFKILKKDTRELVKEDYKFLDFSNSPVATYFYSELPPASKFMTMTAAAQPKTQKVIIDELENTQKLAIIWSGPGFRYWDYISNTVRNYELSNYILENFKPYKQRRDGFEIWLRETDTRSDLKDSDLYNDPSYSCDFGLVPNTYKISSQVKEVQLSSIDTKFGISVSGQILSDLVGRNSYVEVKNLDEIIAYVPLNRRYTPGDFKMLIPLEENIDKELSLNFRELSQEISNLEITIQNNTALLKPFKDNSILNLKVQAIDNLQSIILESSNFDFLKISNLNDVEKEMRTLYLSGWVFNRDKTPIKSLKILNGQGVVISSTEMDIKRPDVAGAYGMNSENLGFSIEFKVDKEFDKFSIETDQGAVLDLSVNDVKKLFENGIKYENPKKSELTGYIEALSVYEKTFSELSLNKGGLTDSITMKLIDENSIYNILNKGCEQKFSKIPGRYYMNFNDSAVIDLNKYVLQFYKETNG